MNIETQLSFGPANHSNEPLIFSDVYRISCDFMSVFAIFFLRNSTDRNVI